MRVRTYILCLFARPTFEALLLHDVHKCLGAAFDTDAPTLH